MKKTYYKELYFFLMAAFGLAFLLLLFLTHGKSADAILFSSDDQTFMDFFNCLLYNVENPYENYAFYPPLASLVYKVLVLCVPDSALTKYVDSFNQTSYTSDVKILEYFYVPFILYSLLTFVGLYIAIKALKKGKKLEKYAMILFSFFSLPMLFMFERGNNIIVALIFSLLFVAWYDSENRALREVSLVFIAIAVSFKIYPALFCILLLNKKRFWDILKVIGYVLVLTLTPMFIFYGGFDCIKSLLQNLNNYGDNSALQIGSQLNFGKCVIFPLYYAGLSNETLLLISDVARYSLTGLCCLATLFVKKPWQKIALCCCIIYGFQQTCSTYLLILFIIPIIMLLDSEHEHNFISYFALFAMTVTQILLVSIMPDGTFSRIIGTKISSYAVFVLSLLLIYVGIVEAIKTVKNIKTKDKKDATDLI